MKLLKNSLTYILALLIILQCYSLLSMLLPNRYFYIAIAVLLLTIIFCGKKIKQKNSLLLLGIIYVVIMFTLLVNVYYRNMEFLFSVIIPFPLFLMYSIKRENIEGFFEAYTNIVFVIACLSLFFFIFGSVLGIVKETGYYPYTTVGWGTNNYHDYYHLYCEGQEVYALGYSGVRNIALFVEGPMLTYVLSIAFYYELFLREKGYRKIYIFVMILTYITSFSTTGLLLVLGLLYLKFYTDIKNNKFVRYLFVPLIIALVIYGGVFILKDKFVSNVYSSSVRTDDILASFKCFLANCINGVGYQNLHALDPFRRFFRNNAGLSTGLGAIFAYGGFTWGIWYLIPLIIAIKNYILEPKSRKIMGLILMLNALLLVTVVHSRILCTITNALSWTFILQTRRNIKFSFKV